MQYRNLNSVKTQANNPSIIGGWNISTSVDQNLQEIKGINRDPNQMQGKLQEKHGGVFLAYADGVVKDLFSDDSDSRNVHESNRLMEYEDEYKIESSLSWLGDEFVPEEAEVVETVKEKEEARSYFEIFSRLQESKKQQRIIAQYGLIDSQKLAETASAKEQLLEFFIPAVHADELPEKSINNSELTTLMMPFDYEAFHEELFSRIGIDGSLISETFLERMKREYKDTYFKATLENNHIKQEQSRTLFAWTLDKYRSLKDQFELTDWRPLGTDYKVQSYTVGVSKDKIGKRHYRDLDTGRFSKSSLEKAKNSFRQGKQPVSQLEIQATEKLHDYVICHTTDFGRSSMPGIETGGRVYLCNNKDAGYHVDKDGIEIGGSIGFDGGVNLASGTVDSDVGGTRLDLDVLSGTLEVGGVINHTKAQKRFGIKLKAKVDSTVVKGEFKSKKLCTKSNCYKFKLNAQAGIGLGIELGGEYNKDIEKQDMFTFSAGLGLIPALTATITVEKEPNKQNIDNNFTNIPRPSS